MSLSNSDLAGLLERIGTLMKLAGENDFKAMAFDRAARTVESLTESIRVYVDEKRVESLKGIGKSIAKDIYEWAETGEMKVLSEFEENVPKGLLRWLDISGLGPKKIYKIHKELGITELEELKEKCEDGSVAALAGMGKKSAEKILKSIEWMEKFSDRCRIDEADAIAQEFLHSLKGLPGVQDISVAGSLRRSRETIGDIDILIAADETDSAGIFDAFVGNPSVTEVLGRGNTKSSVRTDNGRQVDLRIVRKDQFPAALMYFTGSKEHNVVMRQRARDRNMSLNEYGLFSLDKAGNTDFSSPIDFSSEADIYRKLDLAWVPPELREDKGEFSFFESQEKADLLEQSDVLGVLHAHSTWSDGKYSIEEMARACFDKGYQYLGLTDHSRSAAYAGGLSIERVQEQWREIDALNERFQKEDVDFKIFKGIESDILADGSLDYPDDVLSGFDFVIASVHSSLDMPVDKMLERFKRAAENRFTSIIGHPTGRLLLKRDGNSFDLNALIEHASEYGTAIEINASPWRLDLDWRYGNKARECGLFTAICPDAHSIEGIDDILWGVKIARKARFSPSKVLNTMSGAELENWFRRKRG